MDLNIVFKDFVSKLKKRKGFLSEDNIRFYWFVSMLKQDPNLNHYSLEEPYLSLPGKELDLMYENDKEGICFEIKFHRHKETQKTFPHTMAAGEIFDDIIRLPKWNTSKSICKPTRYLFLYVTDEEMNSYLSVGNFASKNKKFRITLDRFYNADRGCTIGCEFKDEKYGGDTPKTFLVNACESCPCEKNGEVSITDIVLIDKCTIESKSISLKSSNCYIRLYDIK